MWRKLLGVAQKPPLHMDGRSACGQNLLFCPCRLRRRLSVDANLLSSSLQCLLVPYHCSVHCISLQHQNQVLSRGSYMKHRAALHSEPHISGKSPCMQTWACAHHRFCCKCIEPCSSVIRSDDVISTSYTRRIKCLIA